MPDTQTIDLIEILYRFTGVKEPEKLDFKMKEGDVKIIKKVCVARECALCEEEATHKMTFLLPNSRNNSNSKGYGKDDISWCEDGCVFVCDEHNNEPEKHGFEEELFMDWCSTFPKKNFEHMFLYWEESEEK